MARVLATPAPFVSITSQILAKDTGANGADGITHNGAVTLAGLIAGPSGSYVRIYDGLTLLGVAALNSAGGWTYSKTLGEGAHALRAVLVEPNGQTISSHIAPTLLVETVKPTVSIKSQILAQDTGASSADRVTSNGAVSLTGSVSGSAGVIVQVFDGATLLGNAKLDGKGGWTFATTLGAGTHALRAAALDLAGNETTTAAQPAITVDTTTPTVSYSVMDQTVGANVAHLYGTYSGPAGSRVDIYSGKVDLGSATIGANNTWSFATPSLASGNYGFSAVVTTPAGKTAAFASAPPMTIGSVTGALDLSRFHTIWDQNFTQNQIDKNIFPIVYGNADQFAYGAGGLTLTSYRSQGFANVGVLQANWSASGAEGYGLFSATASVPAGQGTGVAILLWLANNVWPGPEMDMVEDWSDPTGQSAVFSLHAKNPVDGTDIVNSIHYSVDLTKPTTFSLDWEAGSLTYYVNGAELFQLTGAEVPKDFADGGVNASFGAQITGIGNLFEPKDIVALTISDLNYKTLAPAPASISVSNPGAIAMTGTGPQTVAETITGVNLPTSTVYVMVMNAANVAYNGWQPVTLDASGVGTFAASYHATGDYLVVSTNPAGGGVTGWSAPISLAAVTLASGVLAENVSHDHLWLERSGNDLVIDILGTNQRVYIDNGFSNTSSLQQITASDGLKLDGSILGLENAMAGFQTAHPGFNEMTTTHMSLNDAFFAGGLGAAEATAWLA